MADPYDRGARRRGGFNHWLPLLVTVTIATAGVAAWAWSQRNSRDDDYDDVDDDGKNANRPLDYEGGDRARYGENASPPAAARDASTPGSSPASSPGHVKLTDATAAAAAAAAAGWLGNTGTPQQWAGTASKAVSAGLAAASAAVGGALASIREGDQTAYADHETWSEEVDARKDRVKPSSSRRRKAVVLVVSADTAVDTYNDGTFHENASILSYIPRQNDFSKVRIFVLVYAPGYKDKDALDPAAAIAQPPSLSSSFSNIGPDAAQSPKSQKAEDEALHGGAASSPNAAFAAVNAQALRLVEKESDIIPFTSPTGHAHILRLLEPDIVYVQESLTGDNGTIITQLQSWMRNDVVVVVGTENGGGGLADSESEAEKSAREPLKWWQREDRVGRGRGVVVVDGLRVSDDWIRRVQEQE